MNVTHLKHKVVELAARRISRIVTTGLNRPMKRASHRAYRRHVRQLDHSSESVNYEPTTRKRVTSWDVA